MLVAYLWFQMIVSGTIVQFLVIRIRIRAEITKDFPSGAFTVAHTRYWTAVRKAKWKHISPDSFVYLQGLYKCCYKPWFIMLHHVISCKFYSWLFRFTKLTYREQLVKAIARKFICGGNTSIVFFCHTNMAQVQLLL